MSHPNHRLPTGVQQRLSSLRARNRRLAITLSAIWGLSALLGLMCVALFLDGQFVVFDQRLRALLTGGCLAVAAWAAWRAARPLLARLGWLSTASIVDQELPAMQERWTTVSQIDESEESSPMSQAMAEQVRREAAAMAPA